MATELTAIDAAEGPSAPEKEAPRGFLQQIGQLGTGRILALGAVALALLGFFAFVIARSLEQPMTLLFGGLAPADAQQIITRLDTMSVPYRLTPAGDAIMVPADRALRLRLDLAQEGVIAGGAVGYEVFDKSSQLGSTDFLSNLNLKRALEGELARTIGSIHGVAHARVHIVMPRRELFERDRQQPTASIVLGLRNAGGLDARQVQGIRNLVAAAVPGLDPGKVTIVDDRGNLLSRPTDRNQAGAIGGEIEDQRTAFEQRIKAKLLQILERSVGPGRVEAEVTADLDFDDVSTTAESFDPTSQVARSSQTVEENGERREADASGAVSVANNLPTERSAQQGGGTTGTERNTRTEETTNFEISRTVRNQTRRGGVLRRLSIAVQVDGVVTTAADGSQSMQPRGPEELAQLAALVRSAAGVDEERGDVVEVISRPFLNLEPAAAPDGTVLSFSRDEYWRLAEIGAMGLIALLLLVFGVRPLIRSFQPKPEPQPVEATLLDGSTDQELDGPAAALEAAAIAEAEEQETVDILNVRGRVSASLVKEVSRIVEQHPDHALRVIRDWIHES